MKIMQVKQYHQQVADNKWNNCDKVHNVRSMFYFMLEDSKGYSTELRQKGYVAFNDTKAVFDLNRDKAIEKANKYGY